jgi:hypothetical protein
LAFFGASVALLGAIAFASPAPDRVTDRGVYEKTAAMRVVPDCSDLHCFRALVPWVLGRVPGASTGTWKTYAVICNAASGVAVLALAALLGLSPRAAGFAAAASAIGFGSLYTLHDPYTSDPLMFFIAPVILTLGLTERIAAGAVLAAVGVTAKEFAAAPLYIVAGCEMLRHRWRDAFRALAGANVALIAWLAFTLWLMLAFNYSWGATDSANFSGGAEITAWLQRQSARGIVAAMFNEFGAIWLLAPAGFLRAGRTLRILSIVAVPFAAILCYVQQPDRALWNFHFLMTPLAALALEPAPILLATATLIAFGVGNLRVGAQLPIAGLGRVALAASVVLAAGDVWFTVREA